MKKEIKTKYDGKYPCLCMGHLEVWVDGKYYDFGKYCLSSGGSFIRRGLQGEVYEGEWDISKYPKDFPEDLKEDLLAVVNREIPLGCCGGCL